MNKIEICNKIVAKALKEDLAGLNTRLKIKAQGSIDFSQPAPHGDEGFNLMLKKDNELRKIVDDYVTINIMKVITVSPLRQRAIKDHTKENTITYEELYYFSDHSDEVALQNLRSAGNPIVRQLKFWAYCFKKWYHTKSFIKKILRVANKQPFVKKLKSFKRYLSVVMINPMRWVEYKVVCKNNDLIRDLRDIYASQMGNIFFATGSINDTYFDYITRNAPKELNNGRKGIV